MDSSSSVFAAGVALQLQPLTWVAVALIVGVGLLTWLLRARRAGQELRSALPQSDVISYVGGGRWRRVGIGGLDARWPLVRLAAGRDSLYFGPNDRWPLARLHAIPRWTVALGDVDVVSAGVTGVHLKLKDGHDLVFSPLFTRPTAIVEALVARGYPAGQSST